MSHHIVEVKDLKFHYPDQTPALRGVSFQIRHGEAVAIVGANGAGKSTLGYAIAGYVPHFYHGELAGVIVAGRNTREATIGELVSSVGLVFQNPFNQIPGTRLTVREEIAFGMENLGVPREVMEERCQAVMELVGICEIAERSPVSLSGGQMQRVAEIEGWPLPVATSPLPSPARTAALPCCSGSGRARLSRSGKALLRKLGSVHAFPGLVLIW